MEMYILLPRKMLFPLSPASYPHCSPTFYALKLLSCPPPHSNYLLSEG